MSDRSAHFEWFRSTRDYRFWFVCCSPALDDCYGPGALDGHAVVDDFGSLRMVSGDVRRARWWV